MKMVQNLSAPLLLIFLSCGCAGPNSMGAPAPADSGGSYSTKFSATENPISESEKWVNGEVVGLDWANVYTTPGRALGNQTGPNYSDATAVLQNMEWAPDQKATAVVSTSGAPLDNCYQEAELRLRTEISPHSITGYEINYKFSNNSTGYMQIVRWNGGFGDFTTLRSFDGQQYGAVNGNVVSATIVGNVITAYKNGVQQGQVTDDTFSTGSPGIGFNLTNDNDGCLRTNGTYGISSFTALDSTRASF
jgi:hypothetical protein